jgi:hypothetical protein
MVRGMGATKYGRYQVAETPHSLLSLHVRTAESLREVEWTPPLGVLDQEDLVEQGIHVATLVPGAKEVDALGSCVANAGTAALSAVLPQERFFAVSGCASYTDVVTAEKFAIQLYHYLTDETGDPSTEWPPTDCGSSGPYLVEGLVRKGLIAGAQVASGADNIVSLLQGGGVVQGTPFFTAWETPDEAGFVDGNGTHAALEAAIRSGVAGGHETYIWRILKLVLSATAVVDPFKTILVVRNSWTESWGDEGNFLIHLSTLEMLGGYCDFRRFTPVAAPVPRTLTPPVASTGSSNPSCLDVGSVWGAPVPDILEPALV